MAELGKSICKMSFYDCLHEILKPCIYGNTILVLLLRSVVLINLYLAIGKKDGDGMWGIRVLAAPFLEVDEAWGIKLITEVKNTEVFSV